MPSMSLFPVRRAFRFFRCGSPMPRNWPMSLRRSFHPLNSRPATAAEAAGSVVSAALAEGRAVSEAVQAVLAAVAVDLGRLVAAARVAIPAVRGLTCEL